MGTPPTDQAEDELTQRNCWSMANELLSYDEKLLVSVKPPSTIALSVLIILIYFPSHMMTRCTWVCLRKECLLDIARAARFF